MPSRGSKRNLDAASGRQPTEHLEVLLRSRRHAAHGAQVRDGWWLKGFAGMTVAVQPSVTKDGAIRHGLVATRIPD